MDTYDLDALAQAYEEARTRKEELSAQLDAAKQALTAAEEALADGLVEADKSSTQWGGRNYSLKCETKYGFLGAEKLAEKGLDKFAVLRENGFDYLIKETVDAKTLNSTMKAQAETEDGIPDDVMEVLSTYDVTGISRTKAKTSALKKAKGES